MVLVFFQLGFALILSLIHFYSERYSIHIERYHGELISFSAGLFITYIFLYLFPELLRGIPYLGEGLFLLVLVGFVVYHLAQKYLYQHIRNKKDLMQDLASLHIGGYFIDHFIVGIILFLSFNTGNLITGMLVFVPLMLHTLSSSLAMNHIDEHVQSNRSIGLLLSVSPVIGVLFANAVGVDPLFFYALFSFGVGALLYVVIKDAIPEDQQGKPAFFLTGFLISYIVLLLVSWLG